jgi:hypothetical protein
MDILFLEVQPAAKLAERIAPVKRLHQRGYYRDS